MSPIPHNPDMIACFQEVSLSHLRRLPHEKGTTIAFYGSGFFDAFKLSNLDDAIDLETSADSYIRINDYFITRLFQNLKFWGDKLCLSSNF
jgi:hypothetical protein